MFGTKDLKDSLILRVRETKVLTGMCDVLCLPNSVNFLFTMIDDSNWPIFLSADILLSYNDGEKGRGIKQ